MKVAQSWPSPSLTHDDTVGSHCSSSQAPSHFTPLPFPSFSCLTSPMISPSFLSLSFSLPLYTSPFVLFYCPAVGCQWWTKPLSRIIRGMNVDTDVWVGTKPMICFTPPLTFSYLTFLTWWFCSLLLTPLFSVFDLSRHTWKAYFLCCLTVKVSVGFRGFACCNTIEISPWKS
jgi:hypothetical protein